MPRPRPILLLTLSCALVLASAAEPDPALDTVQEALSRARSVAIGEGTRDEKLVSLRVVAREMLDTREMGSRAIGATLAAQAPPQQEEYFELFGHVIVRAYLSKLLLFREPRFEYEESRRKGDSVFVRTRIITVKDKYHVDYEMREVEGRWTAADVIVEGVSLNDNYRAQFASLLRGRSFDELLDLMRRKTRRLREKT